MATREGDARSTALHRGAGGFRNGAGFDTRSTAAPGPPDPASESGPPDPAFRANPFPEVTDLFCRLPLPTFLYRLEADHLGDLMRL